MIQNILRRLAIFACVILVTAIAPYSVDAQGKAKVVGVWNATAQTDQGEMSSVWTFKKSGDTISGSFESSESGQKRDLSNVSFDGKELKFELEMETQGEQILIKVESEVVGNKLTGSWSANRDGEELATGSLNAEKKIAVRYSGARDSTATLPDGEEMESTLVLKGKNKELSGSINPHDDETKIDKITAKPKSLRMEFVLDVEGEARDIVIEASLDSENSLKGKWILLDGSGGEEASGDWKAKRSKPKKTDSEKPQKSGSNTAFDGTSLASFRGYNEETIGSGWTMENGVLHLDGTKKTGDIITRQEFGDFELEFEWKISEGGNSGVMYRVSLGDRKPYLSGPEYQVLDDAKHKDGKLESHRSGSLYALYPPKNKTLKPVGQWNTSKIVLNGNNVEHWLNGQKVVAAEIGSDDWNEKVADSKFKSWEKFGKNKKGHICFQDHGNPVWYRNIKIKSLD